MTATTLDSTTYPQARRSISKQASRTAVRTAEDLAHDYGCVTCLGFRFLPGVGPCPDCRSHAYAEFVLAAGGRCSEPGRWGREVSSASTRTRWGDAA